MDDYIFGGALKANDIKLYTQNGEEAWDLGCGNCELTTSMSAKSNLPVIQSLITNHTAAFSCICGVDLTLMGDMTYLSNKPRTIMYEVPIMIQARWHKKNRINKKWLKRYGMKPDAIKVEMNIRALEYIPEHIDNESRCKTSPSYTYNSWNFETDIPIYKYRPDQMRRNLKIQW